jgi:hypothetical protein
MKMRRLLLAFVFGIIGCTKRPADENEISTLSKEEVNIVTQKNFRDFSSNTARYKGFNVQVEAMWSDESPSLKPGQTLRALAGKEAHFIGLYQGGGAPHITVLIPADLKDVPEVKFGEPLVVAFHCKDGSLTTGNEAIRFTGR